MADILVVDDDDVIRDTLCELFSADYSCQTADTAEDALAKLEAQPFDVVLTDISMPGLNGKELLQKVVELYPGTPVIIISGHSDSPPKVSGVTIAPGMDMIHGTIIDTHFSQRGRHGRLLTAIAHYPQVLGLGIDERTAMVFRNGEFIVIGEGVVTVFDGCNMHYSDLPYRKEDETVGMFGVDIHVLPSGYTYNLKEREPIAPKLTKMAGADNDI